MVSSLKVSAGISQISSSPGNNGPANQIPVTRDWFLAKTMVLCDCSKHDSQVSLLLFLIDG